MDMDPVLVNRGPGRSGKGQGSVPGRGDGENGWGSLWCCGVTLVNGCRHASHGERVDAGINSGDGAGQLRRACIS